MSKHTPLSKVKCLPSLQNPKARVLLCPLLIFLTLCSCASHLKDAKFYYSQGMRFSRNYQTEKAVSFFKKALTEAELEVRQRPSSQAYVLKGMAEANLKLWKEAEQSFLDAFSFEFEKGEEWARQVSLTGLASSLEAYGLEDSAFEIYAHLVDKANLRPVAVLAAQKYLDRILQRALQKEGKEKQRLLAMALSSAKKLTTRDMSCGFYHYLQSQIYSHLADYNKSFEEAVLARELGLISQEVLRDNDLQIVFCYQKLKENLSSEEWEAFHSKFMQWVKKWNWEGPERPDWKRRS